MHEAPRHPDSTFRLRGTVAGRHLVLSLRDGLNRLGSHAESDLTLAFEGVSRQHAILVAGRGQVEVIDCGSKNGTFVDGERIERAKLEPGSRVRFGPHELELETLAPDDAVLAWEMTPWPGSNVVSEAPTTASVFGARAGVERWFAVIKGVAEQLRRPAGAGHALAFLADALEIRVALFCRFSDAVELLAARGEFDPEAVEGLRRQWRGVEESPAFLSHQTLHAVAVREGEAGVALVFGPLPALDGQLRGTLPILLSLFLLWSDIHSTGETAGGSGPPWRFPAGYVRGRSPAMERLHEQIFRIATVDLPVLIVGETGVGKEWVARMLHQCSARRDGPLVAINCAAIPADLLEAELFGIGRKVATGVSARPGRFQQAHGGTLLLDEIGEMPQELQAKLLRVLQEGRIEPLGAPARDLDVRLLAATNADVDALVEDGGLRKDLYFRLAGFVLEVPPLRCRREDIPLFIESIARAHASALGKPIRGITVHALRSLMSEPWPGNVRELEHRVRQLVHLCPEDAPIDSTLLDAGRRGAAEPVEGEAARNQAAPYPSANPSAQEPSANPSAQEPSAQEPAATPWRRRADLDLATIEREAVQEALHRTGGNQVQAAKLLGISRYSLRRRLE